MRSGLGKYIKRCFAMPVLFSMLVLSLLLPAKALAAKENGTYKDDNINNNNSKKTVRVGFPIQDGMSEITPDGEYTGYNADYLKELIKYTDWEIEYVTAEGDINTQINTLGQMLDTGEIDMLGTMNISDYLQELYLYPAYSYGNTYTALTVPLESTKWQSYDFACWNGMRVAACPSLVKRMEQLEQFAAVSGFEYEIVEYEDIEAVKRAVMSGEADAYLQVDIGIPKGMRAIARFNPSPFYFALNKERADLLKELNAAMYNLLDAYPGLQSELYSHYFVDRDLFTISEQDRQWIEGLEPLRVLYFEGNAPIQDRVNDKPTGVANSFMESFCEVTGLKTVPVFVESFDEARKLVDSGEVDLLAAVPGSRAYNYDSRIRITHSYFDSTAVWVTKGVPKKECDTLQYLTANTRHEMYVLKNNENKATLMDAYCVSDYLRKKVVYDGLYAEWADREDLPYSVGVMPSVDDRLIGILNGYVNSIGEQEKRDMLYENSNGPIRYTLAERLNVYKWVILLLIIGIIIPVIIIMRVNRLRTLRQNAVEIEHLHQFSIIFNECILKYDVKRDLLIMQNNKLVYPDRQVLKNFLSEDSDLEIRTENERRFVERLREMLRNVISVSELELIQDEVPTWFRINLAFVEDFVIGRKVDINDEVMKRNLLEHEASHDALTGMMNRSAIYHCIKESLSRRREGVFLLMDLDNFKKVNDTLGHNEGDKVLKAFAAFLEKSFRGDDLKARLGGDEFVVFLTKKIPEDVLGDKINEFIRNVHDRVFVAYESCGLSVSVGAAYVSESAYAFKEIYRQADVAMYVAKFGGKNSYFINDGSICSRTECEGCKDSCKKRDYLIAHGVTDPDMWNVGADNFDSDINGQTVLKLT